MKWIGLMLMVISAYPLNLLQAQSEWKRGSVSVLDANEFVKNPTIQLFTTFVTLLIILAGLAFLILSVEWWTPVYAIFGILAGGLIRKITGNPLLG